MIKGAESFSLPTVDSGSMQIVVNWNPLVENADFVKVIVNGEEVVIPRVAFVRAAMVVGTADEQENMIPVKQIQIRKFKKTVTIKLAKDFKQGETIQIPVSFEVPLNGDTLPILAAK